MFLETKMNEIENTLSYCALYPVLGVFPGTVKVAMGIVQSTTAIAFSIFSALPALCQNEYAKQILLRSYSHIPHGVGNIMAGAIEAAPLIGTAFLAIRYTRVLCDELQPKSYSTEITLMEHPRFKFYRYSHSTPELYREVEQQAYEIDIVD